MPALDPVRRAVAGPPRADDDDEPDYDIPKEDRNKQRPPKQS